jgi:DNA-binding transcriptional LysR family regulator
LDHDFVGLNRGSSLLDLISRAAEATGMPLRLRVQVRSFDAMCHIIASNLGIGVVPLQACRPQVGNLGLKVIRLNEAWAVRRLVLAANARTEPSPSAALLLGHLESLAAVARRG